MKITDERRATLIAYALKTGGEYSEIAKMIKNDIHVSDEELKKAMEVKNVITIYDKDYPLSFRELKRPPFVVFYKGNIELLHEDTKFHAIIGSRKFKKDYEEYVKNATRDLCYGFNRKNEIVVSGLAKGVDAIAHTFAQRSIGVIGCGIDYIYPQENASLYVKLNTCGLILSEYPGNTKPLSYHFPFRNRLVAALGDDVCVPCIESQHSGTATTINNALELEKEIFILPMLAYYENFNNELIHNGMSVITHEMLTGEERIPDPNIILKEN